MPTGSLRARCLKVKGKGVLGARETRGAREEEGVEEGRQNACYAGYSVPDRVDTSTHHERRSLRFVADYREKN